MIFSSALFNLFENTTFGFKKQDKNIFFFLKDSIKIFIFTKKCL